MKNEPNPEWLDMARRVAAENERGANFVELFRAAGLDPAKHARYADWSGVDFSGCDLSGFDFTGARLHGCKFEGACLMADPTKTYRGLLQLNDNFAQAEIGQVIHRPGRDPHAPAEMTEVADFSRAEDWETFRRLINSRHMPSLWKPSVTSDAHLPTGAIFQDAPFAPQLVVIPAGSYVQGDERLSVDGIKRRPVTIDYRLAVGRFAVAFEEYDFYCEVTGIEKPNDRGWGRGRRPVINVSWDDATTYAKWLSERTGQPYRLLSESEWEYCCRAGTGTAYHFGETITKQQAQFSEGKPGSAERAAEVGSFPTNAFGLHDMHGNVWEWCLDAWSDSYDGAPDDGRAREDGGVVSRVLRGGSWGGIPVILRSADRSGNHPDLRLRFNGFRLARTLRP